MLRWRLPVAAAIIAVLVGLCWLDFHYPLGRPGVWLLPIALVLSVLATGEMLSLMEAKRLRPAPWVVYGGTLIVVLSAAAPLLWKVYPPDCPVGKLGWPTAGLAAGVVLAFLDRIGRRDKLDGTLLDLAAAVFPMAYVGILMSFAMQLRLLGDNARGMAALLSLIVVVKLSDIGAYAVGRLLGRHKLVPRLSPGKTVEGALGGIAAACLGSYLMFRMVAPWLIGPTAKPVPWYAWLAFGVIVALAGMIGDLAESLLKRDTGRKDSSRWLPGLGGILDVIDSLLVAAPAVYFCWVTKLVGP